MNALFNEFNLLLWMGMCFSGFLFLVSDDALGRNFYDDEPLYKPIPTAKNHQGKPDSWIGIGRGMLFQKNCLKHNDMYL